MNWIKSALFICVVAVGLRGCYKLQYPDYSFRYRLELTVTDGLANYTGSSVIEVLWSGHPAGDFSYRADGSLRGRAPLIDLQQRGVLIASLNSGDKTLPNAGVSAIYLGPRAYGNESAYRELSRLSSYTGRRSLSDDNWPRMLWLPDRSDPNSVRDAPRQFLAGQIGADLRYVDAFVEVTSDPVTVDIEKTLPWYPKWAAQWLSADLRTYNPPDILTLYPYMLNGADR